MWVQAAEAEPRVARYQFTRAELLQRAGDRKSALRCYRRLLTDLGPQQGEDFLTATRAAAQLLHQREDLEEARKCFEEAFSRHPDCVTVEDINLLVELLVGLDQHQEGLSTLAEWCEVRFSTPRPGQEVSSLEPREQLAAFTEILVPDNLAAELRAKLVVILVKLGATHLTSALCQEFLEADTEQFGDLLLDCGEALVQQQQWHAALPLYRRLVGSQRYGEAAVWLQLAECEAETGQLEQAEQSYRHVPHYFQCSSVLLECSVQAGGGVSPARLPGPPSVVSHHPQAGSAGGRAGHAAAGRAARAAEPPPYAGTMSDATCRRKTGRVSQ